jgi:hypothetical protein
MRLTIFLLLMGFAAAAGAAEYFVDSQSGDDAHSGNVTYQWNLIKNQPSAISIFAWCFQLLHLPPCGQQGDHHEPERFN